MCNDQSPGLQSTHRWSVNRFLYCDAIFGGSWPWRTIYIDSGFVSCAPYIAKYQLFQSLIVALVLSRLDYCNSVLFELPANLIQRLQSVQNAAAGLTFRIQRSEHITPALISLHWLRVPERIYFKLHGSYDVSIHPQHLSVLLTVPYHPRFRHDIQTTAAVFYLTSSGRSACSSPYSRQAGVSGFWCHRLERPAFLYVASALSLAVFRQRLKTFLFSRSYQDTIMWLVCYYLHSSLLSGHLRSL